MKVPIGSVIVEVVPSLDVGKIRCPMYSVAPSSKTLVISVVVVPPVGALISRVPAGVTLPSVPVVEMTVRLGPPAEEDADEEETPELLGMVEV